MSRLAILAVVVALAPQTGPPNLTGSPDTPLELALDKGVCTPKEPRLLGGTYGAKVTWHVVNRDCPAQYVSIHRFKKSSDKTPEPTLINPASLTAGPIALGRTRDLTARINKKVTSVERYSYEICVGDTVQSAKKCIGADPDIDVWPS